MRRIGKLLASLAAGLVVLQAGAPGDAADFPRKAVRIVVPYPIGSYSVNLARFLSFIAIDAAAAAAVTGGRALQGRIDVVMRGAG